MLAHTPTLTAAAAAWRAAACCTGGLLAAQQQQQHRALSVLSWGRNAEHQCQPDAVPVVAQPTVVLDLVGAGVEALAAGGKSSAAVLDAGELFTWGDGACGKLALGSGCVARVPSRVEAFVGRTRIRGAALGHQHSLMMDADGQLWACGEGKEGQLGLGTPLHVLAAQHRLAWGSGARQAAGPPWAMAAQARLNPERFVQFLRSAGPASSAAAAAAAGAGVAAAPPAAPHVAHGWGSLGAPGGGRSGGGGWPGGHGRARGGGGAERARTWLGAPGSSAADPWGLGTPAGGLWGADVEAQLHMQPGQVHTPLRVGAVEAAHALWQGSGGGGSSSSGSGLDGEVVVGAAASRFFSAAVTARGEVFTWGSDFNGALGCATSSWQTSATRVAEPITAALAARGGAVAVAAGGTFVAALTASGRVVVWGKLAGGGGSSRGMAAAAAPLDTDGAAADGPDACAGRLWAELALPPGVRASSLAAGQQHLLASDGERVWAAGRWLDANGEHAGSAPWSAPTQLLALPGCGVAQLTAGMHSSGVVGGDGRCWIWGRLLDEAHGRAICRRAGLPDAAGQRGTLAVGGRDAAPASAAQLRAASVDYSWAGFGGAAPRLVDGLSSVARLALGGWHALALVH